MTEINNIDSTVEENEKKRKLYLVSDDPEADGRWRKHLLTERYSKFAGELMQPYYHFSQFGYR
jgi:hypothetical protein